MSDISLDIQNHHIQVLKTARYASFGQLTYKTRYVWIVCHGYGQIASEFIISFRGLHSEEHFFVAPEGLSRFYWGASFTGKPVASWMTSEDRLNEIKDYSNYLDQLYNHILEQSSPKVEFIFFGFSQGCATVMRWCNSKFPKCKAIIIWAGTIPEDIEYDLAYFNDIKLLWRFGTEDKFFTESRLKWHLNVIKEKGLSVDVDSYAGKHKIYDDGLKKIMLDLGI